MGTVKALLNNKWVLIILLGLLALASGGAYSEQLGQLITDMLSSGG